jgi:hypothetical protein
MTIEVSLKRANENVEVEIGQIVPGQIITFSDFSESVRKIISVYCLPDDTGGEVYVTGSEPLGETSTLRAMPPEAYLGQEPEATIGYGGNYERDIVMETRHAARIIFQHIPATQ